jgi:hypothetical protein
MKFENTRQKDRTYHRLIIRPDQDIGYRYLPDLFTRICHNDHAYVLETNGQGFRNSFSFENQEPEGYRILALGDSYLSGDGVANKDRFTDIIGENCGIRIMNMGLAGSGTDQQLLIQEKIAADYDYNALLLVPFVRNLNRNFSLTMLFMEQAMSFVLDFVSGKRVEINKPLFTLNNTTGELTIHNNPVPQNAVTMIQKPGRAQFLRKQFRRLKNFFLDVQYRTGRLMADPEYMNASDPGWRLMRALMERMIKNAGTRPVIIVPFPRHQHIFLQSHPFYLERFKELKSDRVTVIDILPVLRKTFKRMGRKMLLPDGHFTPEVNRIIAECCEPELRTACGINFTRPITEPTSVRTRKLGLVVHYDVHGSWALVMENQATVAAAREEWFTRISGDTSFPWHSIQFCLEQVKASGTDLTSVSCNRHSPQVLRMFKNDIGFIGKVLSENGLPQLSGNASLGPGFSDQEIHAFLDLSGQTYTAILPESGEQIVLSLLKGNKSVGCFAGQMDFSGGFLNSRFIVRRRTDGTITRGPFMAADGLIVCRPEDAYSELIAGRISAILFNKTILVQ